ncbi:MAG: hypothetical protein CM15mP10_1960 [Actinomycetota bacterium]|nr:MAG: hypothetical protein CM15mP10_1960 [Actinomycetota bacterium]
MPDKKLFIDNVTLVISPGEVSTLLNSYSEVNDVFGDIQLILVLIL